MLLTQKRSPRTGATNRLPNLLIKHLVLDVFAQYFRLAFEFQNAFPIRSWYRPVAPAAWRIVVNPVGFLLVRYNSRFFEF